MFLLDSNFIWYKLLQLDMQVCLKKGIFINNVSDKFRKYSGIKIPTFR